MSTRRPKFVRRNKKASAIYHHNRAREQRLHDAARLERFEPGGETYIHVHGHRVRGLVVRKRDGALGTLVPNGFVEHNGVLWPVSALKLWPSGIVDASQDFAGGQHIVIGDWVEQAKYDTVYIDEWSIERPESDLDIAEIELEMVLEHRAAILRQNGGVRTCEYGDIFRADIRDLIAEVRRCRAVVKKPTEP